MSTFRDSDGNEWSPFLNELQQRQLRCVAGAREGDVIHDPRTMIAERPEPRPAAGGYDPENAWLESWNSY